MLLEVAKDVAPGTDHNNGRLDLSVNGGDKFLDCLIAWGPTKVFA